MRLSTSHALTPWEASVAVVRDRKQATTKSQTYHIKSSSDYTGDTGSASKRCRNQIVLAHRPIYTALDRVSYALRLSICCSILSAFSFSFSAKLYSLQVCVRVTDFQCYGVGLGDTNPRPVATMTVNVLGRSLYCVFTSHFPAISR